MIAFIYSLLTHLRARPRSAVGWIRSPTLPPGRGKTRFDPRPAQLCSPRNQALLKIYRQSNRLVRPARAGSRSSNPVLVDVNWSGDASGDFLRACLETTRGAVFGEKAGWQARRRRISLVDLRLRSNEARRPFRRKPSPRRVCRPLPAL